MFQVFEMNLHSLEKTNMFWVHVCTPIICANYPQTERNINVNYKLTVNNYKFLPYLGLSGMSYEARILQR